MRKCVTSFGSLLATGSIFGSNVAMAFEDNVFVDKAIPPRSSRLGTDIGTVETEGLVEKDDFNLASGIYRGEASPYGIGSHGEDEPTGSEGELTQLSGSINGGAEDNMAAYEMMSCADGTENLFELNDDIRFELSVIDTNYLQNGSIEKVCEQDGKHSKCDYNFRRFPNNLQYVCEKDGGHFHETEHSIQCHNPKTEESLYYQFDYYPTCCSATCQMVEVTQMVADRIELVTQTLSNHLDMTCYADDDILRHAVDEPVTERSGGKELWNGNLVLPLLVSATFMIIR